MSAELFEVGKLKGFSPSVQLLKRILAVRVSAPPTLCPHPGLLSIQDYSWDVKIAAVGFVLEFIGFWALWHYAVDVRRFSWIAVLAIALGLFFADIILMLFHHRYAVTKNKLLTFKNAIYKFSTDVNEELACQKRENLIKKNKNIGIIFSFLLILLAIGKIGAVYYLIPIGRSGETPYQILIGLLMVYGGVAYAHIMATGYAVAGYRATSRFNKELNGYADDGRLPVNNVPETDSLPLEEHAIFHRVEAQSVESDSHKISLNPFYGEPNQAQFNLVRVGILTDKQIGKWEEKTKDRNVSGYELTKKAMRLQLQMFSGVETNDKKN